MKRIERQQLYRAVVCAIFAGVIAAPFAEETAYALPVEGTHHEANAGTADISTADKTMNIAGKNDHNILKWEDFSVEKDEMVKFDDGAKTKDYLNLVTGEGASNIYGKIQGGRNVYLINPHGILFAKGSEVNTGALYLSTANIDTVAAAAGTSWDGTSPLSASAQTGSVLNLGTVKANSLYIEGKNVTVLDTNNVTDEHGTPLRGTVGGIGTKAKVRIYSEQTPHIGYKAANKTTIKINVNGKDKQYTVSDYANPILSASASVRAWDVKKLNGGGDHSGYDYMLVHNVYELQHMDARVDMRHGRYMLAHDIDARATRSWYPSTYMGKTYYQGFLPIGRVDEGEGYSNPFKGRFDGVGHKITGLHIERSMVAAGLFSRAWGAVIENVSLSEGYVEGTVGFGGFVGNAEAGSIIRNVSFSGKVCFAGADSIGGIVGWGSNFTIENACNKGTVSAEASEKIGGIIGEGERVTLKNVCNEGTVTGRAQVGGIAGSIKESTVQNALHTGTVQRVASAWDGSRAKSVGSIVGTADNSRIRGVVWREGGFTDKRETFPTDPPSEARAVGELLNHSTAEYVKKRSMEQIKQAATYQDWKDDQGKAVVSGEGGKGTPWRIYEGHTTPLLTGLMRGTKWVKNTEKVYDGAALTGTDHIRFDAEKNVGTYHAYSETYDLIGGAYTIKKRPLTLADVAAQTKTYDGSTAADASKFRATLAGVVNGEENLVSATVAGATYNSKDVAAANRIDYTGVALTGTGAGNYTIAGTVQGAGRITPKQLNLALAGGARFDKTYDGNANVTQTLTKGTHYTLTGFVGTEGTGIGLSSATGKYTDKNAGADKNVRFDGLSLTGAGAGNYALEQTTLTGTGTITRRALTLGAVEAQTKTYDGTRAADASKFRAGLNHAVAGDDITAAATSAAYNDKNVARANRIDYTGVALTGTDAGNYTLAATTAQGAGTITRRALTLGAVEAQSKTYDGNTAADASKFRATLAGVVAGEENSVSATAAGAAYNDKNVARANSVHYTGVALTGTGAGNYTIATTAQGAGTITPRALTLDDVMAQSKTYDGTTSADAAQFRATLGGFVAGEENSVSATAAGAAYNDKNVARANTVHYTGVALTGTGAGNYTIATTAQGAGTITRRALTLGAVEAQTKTYDGTRAADASKFRAGLNHTVAGDDVKAAAAGAAYNDKNVAAASRIDYTGLTLTGADAGNYTLAAGAAEGAGTITRRMLTFDGVTAQTKTYDGNTAADASKFRATLAGVVKGEETSVSATATGAAYNDKNVARANTVHYTGVALTGTGTANYTIAGTAEGAGRITPKQLNLALAGGARFDKTYDGNANVTQSLTKGGNYTLDGFVGTEGTGIELSSATGKYTDKNAGTDKNVRFDGLRLTGDGAGNYAPDKTTLTGTGTITPRALTLGAVEAQTKTYDGTTAADTAKFRARLNHAVAGDDITAAATGAAYNDKNVAGASRVDYTGVALTGADAGNYTLAATTAEGAGTITHRTLTLTADEKHAVQGRRMPAFTGRADGFAHGEDMSVFAPERLTFKSDVANTDTAGKYAVTGSIGGVSGGVLGNYRITQAAGNARAFIIHVAPGVSGLFASLVQGAKPVFDDGFSKTVDIFGVSRPLRAATLGIYRFDAKTDLENRGMRL
nr:YDG domain-containing protein [uncultured Selenomonas sp.]